MGKTFVSRDELSVEEYRSANDRLMGELEEEILGRLDAVTALLQLEEAIQRADPMAFMLAQQSILLHVRKAINLLAHR